MKHCLFRIFVALLLLPCIITSLLAQQKNSAASLTADANKYYEVITSLHINPFTKISRWSFDREMDSLISQYTTEGYCSFLVEMMRINALIGDEHTNLFPPKARSLPMRFDSFEEGLAITGTDSANQQYLLHRILSVNRIPWLIIDSLFRTIIKQDNEPFYQFFLAYYFDLADILNGLGLLSNDSTTAFQLLAPSGDTVTAVVRTVNTSQKTAWILAPPYHTLLAYSEKRNYWFRFDDTGRTLYFNYSHCSEEDDESFAAFNKRLFSVIDELKPEKLVLDLRMNGGGSSGLLTPFIRQIRKNELNSKGRFYVLTGKRVMSSALMNALELKQTSHALFIGGPTGGNINHFGETQSLLLSNTGIRVTYSTRYWENWKGHDGPLIPDIVVSDSLADFAASYDAVLETALKK